MKKIIGVLAVILALTLIIGCNKKEGNNSKGNQEGNSQSTELPITYDSYVGKSLNGNQVREMIKLVAEHNEENDEKISLELDAFKGSRKSTSDKEKISELNGYIGGLYSMYRISYGGDSGDDGSKIVIKQTVGTREDPEIPLEEDEDIFMYGEDVEMQIDNSIE